MHPSTYIPVLATMSGLLASTVSALGINCRGSSLCDFVTNKDVAPQLVEYISHIDPSRWYNNGDQIACEKVQAIEGDVTICAFLQNTGGAPGQNIQGLAHFITEHGCSVCGSVPYFFPGDNNVDNGELTFNAVSDGCGVDGLC